MSDELLRYYERELVYIRALLGEYAAADAHPKIAGRLRMRRDGTTSDPHVQRLIDAFARQTPDEPRHRGEIIGKVPFEIDRLDAAMGGTEFKAAGAPAREISSNVSLRQSHDGSEGFQAISPQQGAMPPGDEQTAVVEIFNVHRPANP